MRYILTPAMAIALLSTPATSQELTFGSVIYDYGRLSPDGDTLTLNVIEGDVEFSYGQLLFGADLKNQQYDLGSDDNTIRNYGLFAGYAITPEILFGAGLTGAAINDDDINGFEVFAQYRTPQYGAALAHARPQDDDNEIAITTFFAEAAVTPEVTLGLAYEVLDESENDFYVLTGVYDRGPIFARAYYASVTDVDGGIYGVRGTYDVTDTIHVLASLERTDEDFFGEIKSFSIGGGYEISEGLTVDASVGQITFNGDDADLINIGLTYTMGNRQRLDREMSDAIREDRRKGIGFIIPDIGIGAGFGGF